MYTILFPSDYFNRNKIDTELEQEYIAAKKAGFGVMLFDYSFWFESKKLVLNQNVDCDLVLYRGWMMKPELYCKFEKQLKNLGYYLIVDFSSYKRLHEFVNVYPIIRNDTAPIMKFPLHTRIDVEFIKSTFGRFMVKDYVKSVKESDFPVYFDSTITQAEFDGWMEKFYQYRGDLLTGGICIKKYLDLKKYDGYTNEYRAFYYHNELMILMKSSNQSDACCNPPFELIHKYKILDSPFFTLDFAQLEDDSWIIIESGDGQVSGITDSSQTETFYRMLKEKN
ncbi:ATP-grasp domain-containing protein [Holdemanella biformis]|uniref:ATP-grasp domain-containing protein n=1 Tax=Holdemanella biformis TaxID=1735 RepID=UPI002670E9F1|nr:ATP-grasp domain-containing protein [Holdemanella biformis]